MPPFASPPPAPSAAEQGALLEEWQRLLSVAPRLAFEKASLIREPLLRDRMRRDAFFAMAARDPHSAAQSLASVIDARWLISLPFSQALDIAWHTVGSEPRLSRQLLTTTAARGAAFALREVRQYAGLPYGAEIWRVAADAAPDQAMALSQGESAVAQLTQTLIRRTGFKGGSAPPAPADVLLRIRQNPRLKESLTPGDILRLGAAASTEDERLTALPMLKTLDWNAPEIRNAEPGAIRGALALMAEAGVSADVPAPVVAAALRGLDEAEDPLREAIRGASLLAAISGSSTRQAAIEALPDSPLGRLLRARLDPARPEARYFPDQREIDTADLFPAGICLQRHFFHNDDDGVESFESFLASYAGDPRWTLERNDAFVHWTATAMEGRRIEIYANIPMDLQDPKNAARAAEVSNRQSLVTKALGNRVPSVIVHRGHDHYFTSTRTFLHSGNRLVFLGSCFGASNVEDVVSRCPRAQMIATRRIGATAVNDAFLSSLNRKLLSVRGRLDWDAFWNTLRPALNGNEHFQAYVPPHRNEAAVFLAGWYRYALSAP
jgi:hypothetical protein